MWDSVGGASPSYSGADLFGAGGQGATLGQKASVAAQVSVSSDWGVAGLVLALFLTLIVIRVAGELAS